MWENLVFQLKAMEEGDVVAISPEGELEYPPPFPVVEWKTVYQFSELFELLNWAIVRGEWMAVSREEGRLCLYNPSNKVYGLYLGETSLIKRGNHKRPPQLMVGERVFTTISDYMGEYDTPQDYLSRARMLMVLSRYNTEEEEKLGKEYGEFDMDKAEGLIPRENHFHKPSVVLYYKGCSPIFGLSGIEKAFPNITPRQLKRLYNKFGVPLPRRLK